MKRSIAMRCTQQQFEGIKDKIDYTAIGPFEMYPYLVSYNSLGDLTNTMLVSLYSEVYKQWDENIFLEACGIESKKIEYQILIGEIWNDTDFEIRIKPKFDKEIEQIKSLAKEIGYNVNLEPIK